MAIKTLSDNIVLVAPPPEPRTRQELADIAEKASKKCDFDIIIDFSHIEVLFSESISNLITLRSWVEGAGRKMVFCNVAVITRCIFDVAGIHSPFEFAKDEDEALTIINRHRSGQMPLADTDKKQNTAERKLSVRSRLRRIFGFHIFKR
jgi:anti-anti-sigma regulatory factor